MPCHCYSSGVKQSPIVFCPQGNKPPQDYVLLELKAKCFAQVSYMQRNALTLITPNMLLVVTVWFY